MQLRSIYRSDINRDINAVIKVAQNDALSMEQELREYIVTRELHRHFSTLLQHYERSIHSPTDKIGVWISGFFGSGKSHFLKILSYLLGGETVAGKQAVEYLADRFDDPMLYEQLQRCARVPGDAMVFNIDAKSSLNKDSSAILRVFAKVFYEYRGFYGDDLKVAKLEQFIEKSGKTQAFKTAFQARHGQCWEEARTSFSFLEDSVVSTLTDVLGMSRTAASNWFNGKETGELSIEQLVREIKEYIDTKGTEFRLLFMVDEVGQYIGTDGNLMLNLQTLVEEIGSKCDGRVWVMVTSQESIDTVTKISGGDFSKILGRFDTRLSLSSASVDEVIQKRLLAKTEEARDVLRDCYRRNSAVLKNLFSFDGVSLDLKGFAGEEDFVQTYPFVPYQFRLMQEVLAQIRSHGNAGKHLSGGERSMLSGFQEAAQAVQELDENALVPFSLFYNTVHTFLDSTVRGVIDRCQKAADQTQGIEPDDVNILKLLYLIRYVDGIKANVDNITTLMIGDIRTDKLEMRRKVQASLDRLVVQNYVARHGDTYTFLTEDEQQIQRQIRNTMVDSAAVVQAVSQIIFGELFPDKKFRYGNRYDFAFDRSIDRTAVGKPEGGIGLRILTEAAELYHGDEQLLLMRSNEEREAIMRLSDRYPYFEDLEYAAKIRKYAKSRNVAQLPEAIGQILRNKLQEAAEYEKAARDHLASAILDAKIYVAGEVLEVKASCVKNKLEAALNRLIRSVYSKLNHIEHHFDFPAQLRELLSGGKTCNPEAMEEICGFLQLQSLKRLPTSVTDIQNRFGGIPYGWRMMDIAAAICGLIGAERVTLHRESEMLSPTDPNLVDHLYQKEPADGTLVKLRTTLPPGLLENVRSVLKEYFNTMDVPAQTDALTGYVVRGFTEERQRLQRLLEEEYTRGQYPDRKVVEDGVKLCSLLLSHPEDPAVLLQTVVDIQDDLLDLMEDLTDVMAFFKNQKPIFDSAAALLDGLSGEMQYLQEQSRVIEQIRMILQLPKPYRSIAMLPGLTQQVQDAYALQLEQKRRQVCADIQAVWQELSQSDAQQKDVLAQAEKMLSAQKTAAEEASTLTRLDALRHQLTIIRQQCLKALSSENTVTVEASNLCAPTKLEKEADIDRYVAAVKEKLLQMLDGHDAVQII